MNIKKIFFILFFIFFINFVYGQDDGKIDIKIDEKLEQKGKNLKNTEFHYYIQIFSSTSKSEAEKIKKEFQKKYKNIKIKIDFKSSSFKVRVGYYSSFSDAELDLEEIKKIYPKSIIVKN